MRVLLDECIDERFRHEFPNHDCQTARFAELAGFKNGQLLTAAESLGFEVLITVDRGIPYQQNLTTRRLAVIVLCLPKTRLSDLKTLVLPILITLASIVPAQVVRLPQT